MKIGPGRMVGWNFPNSEICVRVARYEFSKNHPTFPTKYSNSLYVSELYGRFSVVFFFQKIYPSYFFFQNRLFFEKKFFWVRPTLPWRALQTPPGDLLRAFAMKNGRFSLYSEIFSWHDFCIWAIFLKSPQYFLTI